MKIWHESYTLDQINEINPDTIHASLGIVYTSLGEDYIEATMPVDERTRNPVGILHGGASVVLAESLGSIASILVVGGLKKPAPGSTSQACIGLEINASHLESVKEGFVIGRATPIRLGKSIHVWNIQIREGLPDKTKTGRPICHCRLTTKVMKFPMSSS